MKAYPLPILMLLASCTYDPGGPLERRATEIANNPPSPLEHILCESACTMRLARDCVGEGAIFMFHGPWRMHPPLTEAEFDEYSELMASHYSPELAEWFMATGRYSNHYISGDTLIERGWADAC